MKKTFIIGFGVALLLLILGFFTKNTALYGTISIAIAIVFLLIGGLTSGVFNSGDRMRANYHTENKEDRAKRSKVSLISGIIALPHFLAGIVLFTI